MLPALLHWHGAALRFDLRPLNISIEDILFDRIAWNVAWNFISEILRDSSSHLCSAVEGDTYAPTSSERAAWSIAELELNTQRKKGSSPIRLPRPWAGKKPTYRTVSTVPNAAREARREKLANLF